MFGKLFAFLFLPVATVAYAMPSPDIVVPLEESVVDVTQQKPNKIKNKKVGWFWNSSFVDEDDEPKEEKEIVPIEVVEKEWKCPTCNADEQYVLAQLQEHTKISDRNALATIMGNIKQESKFIPNICEGGARVPYHACRSGGYGLIQWTSVGRYNGLGNFCRKYGCDPSSLEGQTRYMINEDIFQRYLPEFEGNGQKVRQYMVPAYYWLGWGIKGNRESYAYNYTKKLVLA